MIWFWSIFVIASSSAVIRSEAAAVTCPTAFRGTRPHATECNKYFQCLVLPSKRIIWSSKQCEEGLIFDKSLGQCVVPDNDWECVISGEEEEDYEGEEGMQLESSVEKKTKHQDDQENVYGVNNLSEDVDSSGTGTNEEDDDRDYGNYIRIDGGVDDHSSTTTEMDTAEEEYSGDGTTKDEFNREENSIDLPTTPDPDGAITSYLQRLTQLIDGLQKSNSSTASKEDKITPDKLNSFVIFHKIKSHKNYNPSGAIRLPEDGKIHQPQLDYILRQQNLLNSNLPNPVRRRIIHIIRPAQQQIQPVSRNVSRVVVKTKYDNQGSSGNSQIVVNRPEGSVLFNVRPLEPILRPEPSISEQTLKSVLELSKQLVSHQKLISEKPNYLQPVVQPVYYTVPVNVQQSNSSESSENGGQSWNRFKNRPNGNNKNKFRPIYNSEVYPTSSSNEEYLPAYPPLTSGSSWTNYQGSLGQNWKTPHNPSNHNQRPNKFQSDSSDSDFYQFPSGSSHQSYQSQSNYPHQSYHSLPLSPSSEQFQYPTGFSSSEYQFDRNRKPYYDSYGSVVHHQPQSYNSRLPPSGYYYNNYQPLKPNRPESSYENSYPNFEESQSSEDSYSVEDEESSAEAEEEVEVEPPAEVQIVDESLVPNEVPTTVKPLSGLQLLANQLLLDSNNGADNRNKIVNINGNYMSYDTYRETILPLLSSSQSSDTNLEIITCSAGVRHPNASDCTKYYVCNPRTGSLLGYSCPAQTAFNENTRMCDNNVYRLCKPSAMETQFNEFADQKLRYDAQKALQEAKRVREQALKAQNVAQLIQVKTQQLQNHKIRTAQKGSKEHATAIRRKGVKSNKNLNNKRSEKEKNKANDSGGKRKKKQKYRCVEPGSAIPDSNSIHKYFVCYRGLDGRFRRRSLVCSEGLVFCRSSRLCTLASRCHRK